MPSSLAALRADWTRRQWLQAGVAGVLGSSLPQLLAQQALAVSGARQGRAKNILLLVEHGGMSHVDTFDPKPEAPAEVRTPFALAATKTPGMYFTELMAKTALISDKIAVVRSMKHEKRVDDHPRGMQYMLSGEAPGGAVEMPDMGTVAAYTLGSACNYLPPYIQLPATSEMAHMTKTGFLPAGYSVFKVHAQNAADPSWKMQAMQKSTALDGPRLEERRGLLQQLDQNATLARNRSAAALDLFAEQAHTIVNSPAAAKAFDLTTESEKMRDLYGPGHRGACYLLGRKLVEAGVRFVTIDVRWPLTPETPRGGNLNWDHHDHIYATDTCELPGASGAGAGRYGIGHWVMTGSLDHAFSGLVVDLEQRGLLDETLVCLVTEFGRTPKVNKQLGRDHWPDAYSIVFAGGGVKGGQIIGATDRTGAFVIDQPHTPEDYAATIYESLGVNRDKPLYTPEQRPIFIAHTGKPIKTLF